MLKIIKNNKEKILEVEILIVVMIFFLIYKNIVNCAVTNIEIDK